MTELRTKLDTLRAHWAAGDRVEALRIAAKFYRLGPQKEAIERGWAALNNPRLYAQMGHDPDKLVAAAYTALAERYELP